jgi:hypothetical protein
MHNIIFVVKYEILFIQNYPSKHIPMVVVYKLSYEYVTTGLHLVHVLNSVSSLDLKINNGITVIVY